jgi:glycosyltransferase involved in cell wall biosynthesis
VTEGGGAAPGLVSVVVTTYNQPRALELVLRGYAAQTHRAFEVVVADDGSTAETAETIARVTAGWERPVRHVWHEDRGFRKTEILNRAILAAGGDYLLFTDGDCIPFPWLVETHAALATPGRFLSGGYLRLPEAVSARITPDDVGAGRATDPRWLRRAGWEPGRHRLRMLRSRRVAALLDALTPTRPTWNGHNASGWRDDVVAANGYDLDMAYGGLDRALGERLENAGVAGRQIRHRAPVLHLHHPRPYADPARRRANDAYRRRIRAEGITRAPRGLAELESA